MKARRAKAWRCSNCGSIHVDTGLGKKQADLCCTCPGCGGVSPVWGSPHRCYACRTARRVKNARAGVAHAKEELEKALAEEKRLKARGR